jgi:Mg2+ and Co2+ transporter CorA
MKQSFADAFFSFAGQTDEHENDNDDTTSSASGLHESDIDELDATDTATVSVESNDSSSDAAMNNWVCEIAARLSLLRENDDDLQVLLMGHSAHVEPVSLQTALALCRRSRRHHSASHLWLDFCNYRVNDVELVRQALSIHPVTIEDCVLVSREKCEAFRRYMAIVTSEQFYRPDSIVIESAQTTILVFQTMTLSFRTLATSPSLLPVLYRLVHSESKGKIPSAHWVTYALLDEIVSRFDRFTRQIVDEVTVLDDLVLQYARSEQTDLLRRIGIARRRMATLQSTLLLKRGVLETLCKSPSLAQDAMESYLRDVLDECSAMLERLLVSFAVLNHLDSVYLTRLSLEVAQSGESMNGVMKKFSAVATIFLPLSTLAGVFGMNVQVPGQNDFEPTYWWFISIVMCMVLAGLLALWYFVRRKLW